MNDSVSRLLPPAFIERVRDAALTAARRAGAIQMNHFRNGNLQGSQRLFDIKLETDRACEDAIIAAIRDPFPDHCILTEESGFLTGTGRFTWVVDPLDGTVNFWHGLPIFCVSVACYRNADGVAEDRCGSEFAGRPVAGVVFLPFTNELFLGVHGGGATLNGRPLRVASSKPARDAVVTVTFGKTPQMMRRMTENLSVLLPRVQKVRCLGAAAVELAYVAAGYLGGLMYEGIKPWDFAAGKILVEEAGGFVKAVKTGKDQWRVVAGTIEIQGDIESLLGI